jgi:ABC-type branched-subunit amino acid transport system substrate-binding protein
MLIFLNLFYPNSAPSAQEPISLYPSRKLSTNLIGCLLPLSGEYELVGRKALRGILAATDTLNEQIGYHVIVKDSGGSIEETRKALEEMVREDEVSLVVGPIPSGLIDEVNSTIKSLQIPTLVFPVSKRGIPDNAYLIKFSYNIEEQARVLARYAVEVIGIKTFGVLNPRNQLGEQFKETFVGSVKALGGDLTYAGSYDLKLGNIWTEIEWVNSIHPQAIFIPDGATRSAEVVKMLKQRLTLGNVLFLGPSTWNSSSFLRAIGNEIDGVVFKVLFTDFFFPGNDGWADFSNRFDHAFGERPDSPLEYQVYEAVKLTLEALKDPIEGREDIMERLLARVDNQRFEITKSMNGGLEITPRPLLLTIQDGNIIETR